MPWLRVRVLILTGVLCLAGQGTLLYLADTGSGAPRLMWPLLFTFLSLLQMVVVVRLLVIETGPRVVGWFPRLTALTATFLLAAVGVAFQLMAGQGDIDGPGRRDPARELARARSELEALAPALGELEVKVAEFDNSTDSGPGITRVAGGAHFRLLEVLPRRWNDEFSQAEKFPLGAVLWEDTQRLAWTTGALPLGPPQGSRFWAGADNRSVEIVRSQGQWFLRDVRPYVRGLDLELQIPLKPVEGSGSGEGLTLQVFRTTPSEATVDRQGNPMVEFVLAAGRPNQVIRLTWDESSGRSGSILWKNRLMLTGLTAWVLLLVAGARVLASPLVFLVVLWLGRAMLAAAEFLRWLTGAFPGQVFPADPGSLFSLVDPAYFATPFAFGWFASVADALLTSLLVAITAWRLLQMLGVVEGSAFLPLRKYWSRLPWLHGPLFGLATALTLLWLRFFAGLLAENANARLIGTGVSLPSLSFWGLQISLMLMAFGSTALLCGLVARRTWPARGEVSGWLAGAAGAAVVAALVMLVRGGLWWTAGLVAAAIPVFLWIMGPALLARPQFLRRFAWPAILLVSVVWNYASLREVYDEAQRSWLQRRGAVITQADPEWTRILLASVLEEMVVQEGELLPRNSATANVWSDEPAWALWRNSALRDLGYSCLVLLMDEEGREESLFAQGFLRTYQYEVDARSDWVGIDGNPADDDLAMIFQTERRLYAGGTEEVAAAEIARTGDRGWIRVELPVRSWHIPTLMRDLGGSPDPRLNGYRPRAEVDRPILLLRADDSGWLEAGAAGFPGSEADQLVADLKSGRRQLVEIPLAERSWLCQWNPLPPEAARTPGEGFLLGLQRSSFREDLLDLSRLMLLNLILLFFLFGVIQFQRWIIRDRSPSAGDTWRPGFQERFLAGYLLLGLVLLLVVGTSVDKVGHDRVRGEARAQTGSGLDQAVEQLRGLLVEQARSLAGSEYMEDLLNNKLAGVRPAGPGGARQGMVFGPDGKLLLDETLSNLDESQARALLEAGREAPLVVVRGERDLYVGTVIPLDLEGFVDRGDSGPNDLGHSAMGGHGFFFYRQILDANLLGSLADLVQGQVMVRFDGRPELASQPAVVFSGQAPLLAEPSVMGALLDHPGGKGVFAAAGRPFAFTGAQPLPAFGRDPAGEFGQRVVPAVLTIDFPDREREYIAQRRATVLFLTGLANLILLTALVLALLMSWNIFRPLRLLLTATRSLAQGDFGAPLPEPGTDEIGRLAGAFSLMRDDLQSARDKLAAREQFLATVLDRVTVGVAVLDANGVIVTLNPPGRQILEDFLPEADDHQGLAWLLEGFRSLAAGVDRVGGELASSDGRRTLRGAMAPLDLPDGRTDTMLVFEDITEFLDNKKMAINAELARQVAHEIKNPLTPIQLSVQLLGQAWRDKHPQLERIVEDTVERVLGQVTLLRSIAGEFSLLGHPGELETETVDLAELVTGVLAGYGVGPEGEPADESLATAAGISVPLVDLEPGPVPGVQAHRESLQKILGNLMQNSLDAGRESERLAIGVAWRESEDQVTLIWTDNGSGLPPEVADRLFDPYFSTKSKGTGLGLAICRNLADRMGGVITLGNRTDGPGAIAELTLPRTVRNSTSERDS